jgi:hypothetical protein
MTTPWRPPIWSSAGPARRRWRRSRPSACRWSWCRIRTPPDTSGATPRRWSGPAPRASSRTRRSTPMRCWPPPRSSTIRRSAAMAAAARSLARPGAAAAVAELVMAAAERRRCRSPGDRRDLPGSGFVTGTCRGAGRGDLAALAVAAEIAQSPRRQRRASTSRWPATPRCASAGRRICSPPPTTRSSSPSSSASPAETACSVRRPRPGQQSGGRRRRHPRPGDPLRAERLPHRGRAPGRRRGPAAGSGGDARQRAGLSGLEFGLAIPGTVGGAVWANAGAHGSDVAAVLESARILRADGSEPTSRPLALGLAYRDSRLKHAAEQGSARSAEIVLEATFRLAPADPAEIKARLDEIRAGAGSTSRWACRAPGACSATRRRLGRPPHRRGGLKGRRVGGASISEKHANFIVNDRGASAPTCAAWPRRSARRSRAVRRRTGIRGAVHRRLVRTGSRRSDERR